MESEPDLFFLEGPDKKASILGELKEPGVVAFAIQAERESSIRGTELFNRMMAYFGDRVSAINGAWRKSESGDPSTNIDKVNELTAAGMSLEEAIHFAWTVTRAKKLGFSKVRVFGQPQGSPGSYTRLEVMIEK